MTPSYRISVYSWISGNLFNVLSHKIKVFSDEQIEQSIIFVGME